MSSLYPMITFRELLRLVMKLGFLPIRQKGSHVRLVHSDGRKTMVPDHGGKDVPQGLLNKIVRNDLEMTMEDFFRESE